MTSTESRFFRVAMRPSVPLLAATLVAGCSQDVPEPSQAAVGTPPSIAVGSEAPDTGLVRLTEAHARTLSVRTVTVSRAPAPFDIQVPGTVTPAPDYYAEVSAPLNGRIASMAVHEGEPVSREQVVA